MGYHVALPRASEDMNPHYRVNLHVLWLVLPTGAAALTGPLKASLFDRTWKLPDLEQLQWRRLDQFD